MNYKTGIVQLSGRGSAETGASHWFGERLKSVALIPLTIIFHLHYCSFNWCGSFNCRGVTAKPSKGICINYFLFGYPQTLRRRFTGCN